MTDNALLRERDLSATHPQTASSAKIVAKRIDTPKYKLFGMLIETSELQLGLSRDPPLSRLQERGVLVHHYKSLTKILD